MLGRGRLAVSALDSIPAPVFDAGRMGWRCF